MRLDAATRTGSIRGGVPAALAALAASPRMVGPRRRAKRSPARRRIVRRRRHERTPRGARGGGDLAGVAAARLPRSSPRTRRPRKKFGRAPVPGA